MCLWSFGDFTGDFQENLLFTGFALEAGNIPSKDWVFILSGVGFFFFHIVQVSPYLFIPPPLSLDMGHLFLMFKS